MGAKYIKVFGDWLETTAMLKSAEKGRLIDALVAYAIGAPYEVSGKVAILFPAFKGQIDRDNASYEAQVNAGRACGKMGGRPKKNPHPFLETPGVSQKPQAPQDKDKDKDKDEDKDKGEDEDFATHTGSSGSAREAPAPAAGLSDNPFGEPDESRPSFDTLEVYAANNLAALTPGNMEELVAFKADMPEALIRHAIDEAAANGKRAWSYVRSILRRYLDAGYRTVGEVKAAEEARRAEKPSGSSPARNYQQHSYSAADFGADFYYDPSKDYPETNAEGAPGS